MKNNSMLSVHYPWICVSHISWGHIATVAKALWVCELIGWRRSPCSYIRDMMGESRATHPSASHTHTSDSWELNVWSDDLPNKHKLTLTHWITYVCVMSVLESCKWLLGGFYGLVWVCEILRDTAEVCGSLSSLNRNKILLNIFNIQHKHYQLTPVKQTSCRRRDFVKLMIHIKYA